MHACIYIDDVTKNDDITMIRTQNDDVNHNDCHSLPVYWYTCVCIKVLIGYAFVYLNCLFVLFFICWLVTSYDSVSDAFSYLF